jgi:hypothetical protein
MDIAIFLFGAVVVCTLFYAKWRSEREICKRLQVQISFMDEMQLRVQVAEWRYRRLKEAIEAECLGAPKTLARLRAKIKWIEDPPPEALRSLPKRAKRRRYG